MCYNYFMNQNNILDILADKKVLYAEDEEGIRRNVSDILELFFDQVTTVENGEDALQELELSIYDVLIFDICMPHIDGLDAINNIRKKDKKVPIIILSAHTEKEYLWRAVELKITKYLTKPYDKDGLIKALETSALEIVDNNVNIKLRNGCIYDPRLKMACLDNVNTKLSKSESRLFEYFIKRSNEVISFDEIYDYMWEFNTPSKEAIKSLIKELRKKMGKKSIQNIYGIGYMLEI